jgi:hypothetical protein
LRSQRHGYFCSCCCSYFSVSLPPDRSTVKTMVKGSALRKLQFMQLSILVVAWWTYWFQNRLKLR